MEEQPFFFEIEDQLKMFLTALDGCIVKRYRGRIPADQVAVRYVYGPKQRALHDLINKAQHITLPAVSYMVKNVQFDTKRVFNKLDGSDQVINGVNRHIPQPLPIRITLDVSILTKYQTDMDQIVSNMVTFFQPYIAISWDRFGLPYHELRSKVIWSGNVSLEYPVDINDNQPTQVSGDTSFVIEGWLFKPDEDSAGIIRTIEATFSALSSISNNIVDLQTQAATGETESFVLSGNPIIVSVYPYNVNANNSYDLNVYGTFYRNVSSVYVSGSVYPSISSSTVDLFSSFPTLSADNPPFNGFSVPFVYNNENNLVVSLPPALSAGFIDVIVVNGVGYGKLTDDSSSPYASGIAVFST